MEDLQYYDWWYYGSQQQNGDKNGINKNTK